METILACVDFSDVTDAVVRTASLCARALGARLVLFHCVPVEVPAVVDQTLTSGALVGNAAVDGGVEQMSDQLRRAKARLVAMEVNLRNEGVDVARALRMGASAGHILSAIQHYAPGLIVMGSHGHGALYHLLMGGTAQRVTKHAACPVMVVPSRCAARVGAAPAARAG